MIVYGIESAPEMTDILLWDASERQWRVGHGRRLIPGSDAVYWVDHSLADVEAYLTDGEPVSVFTRVTHWAQLPPEVEG